MSSLSGFIAPLPSAVRQQLEIIAQYSDKLDVPVYLVGGIVRDILLSRPVFDYDLVTEVDPSPLIEKLAQHWKIKFISRPRFLTATLIFPNGQHIDIAQARRELYPHPGALPRVTPAKISEDLTRRDFTINALACLLNLEKPPCLIDPGNGRYDLEHGLIRIFHSESFSDDPTRIYRAARFAGRFNFKLTTATVSALRKTLRQNLLIQISGARIRDELSPLLHEDNPYPALRLLQRWKVNDVLFANLSEDIPAEFSRLDNRLGKPGREWLGWYLLLSRLNPAKVETVFRKFNLPRKWQTEFIKIVRLSSLLFQRETDPKVLLPFATVPFSPVSLEYLQISLEREGKLSLYQRFQKAKPLIDGNTLKKLGYPPGPIYQHIYRALWEQRWQRNIKNLTDERRFLVDNFPNR